MSSRRKIPEAVQEQVRRRANYLCEYCHASEKWQYVPFTVEHVIPVVRGGADSLDNLALACFHCNRKKADKLSAIEPELGTEVPLFNPRQNLWNEHFFGVSVRPVNCRFDSNWTGYSCSLSLE